MAVDQFCDTISRASSAFSNLLAPEGRHGEMNLQNFGLLVLALLCALAPLELSQVAFALAGAVAYALLQALQPKTTRKAKVGKVPAAGPVAHKGAALVPRRSAAAAHTAREPRAASPPEQQQVFRQPSSKPVVPPTFTAAGFNAEVEELLAQIAPTAESDRVVQQLAATVERTLARTFPELEVAGFASGDLLRGTAFGVAVPEVDIIASLSPHALAGRGQGRSKADEKEQLDVRKLQKSAIRTCTDRLVAMGGFKFRRSAFRGQEPKVTLLVPASLGIHSESIPIDFSVNSTTPLYNAALLTECGHMEPRAKALILLVKRWAKDRGICHAAKGHLSPYAWTLLTIYFMQVGGSEEGELLPPVSGFEVSKGLIAGPGAIVTQPAAKPQWTRPAPTGERRPVGALFREFVKFYRAFDWHNEAVSVLSGKRAPPDLTLPLHIIVAEDGKTTQVGPSIEDPFERKRNLGECTTVQSLARLVEELQRAEQLLGSKASLSELLEPWVPPERSPEDGAEQDKSD